MFDFKKHVATPTSGDHDQLIKHMISFWLRGFKLH